MPLTLEEALAKVARMVASDHEPTLSETDIEEFLQDAAVATVWTPGADYAVGERVVTTDRNRRLYECREPGTSDAVEPSWGATCSQYRGRVVSDGADLVWVDVGVAPRELWDLDAAAYAGWIRKAALIAEGYEFGTAGQTFKRDQVHQHCLRMAHSFAPLVIG